MPQVVKPANFDHFDKALATDLGVVALFMLDASSGNLVDLMTLTTATHGGTQKTTVEGYAVDYNGSQQNNFSHPAFVGTYSFDQYLIAGRILATAQQAANPGAIFGIYNNSGTQCGAGIGWDNSATPKAGVCLLTGNGGLLGAGTAVALNTWHTVYALGQAAGTQATAWVDGLPAAAISTLTGGTTNPNEISIGAQHRAAGFLRNAKGQIQWGAILRIGAATAGGGAVFRDAQAWQLHATDFPFNLFRKARRPRNGATAAFIANRPLLIQQAVNRAGNY